MKREPPPLHYSEVVCFQRSTILSCDCTMTYCSVMAVYYGRLKELVESPSVNELCDEFERDGLHFKWGFSGFERGGASSLLREVSVSLLECAGVQMVHVHYSELRGNLRQRSSQKRITS